MSDGLSDEIAGFLASMLGTGDLRLLAYRRSVEGFSWETYDVGVGWTKEGSWHEREFIIHRAPSAGLLEPYRARPLFELRRALEGLDGVPVPAALWLDDDGTATGRPLYVMEKVSGEVPTQWTSDRFFESTQQRTETARELMGILASLHAAPPSLAPDGILGAGDLDALGEIAYWHEIYRRDCLEPVPALEWGFAWLLANTHSVSGRRALLHGDFRTGNYMVRCGEIVAVLDWEEAHVGDPVQDLAHCGLRLFRGRTKLASGLVPLPDLLDFYEEAAGWEVPRDSFHFWSVYEAVYTTVTMHRAGSLFGRGRSDDVRYAALDYQAHHNHRHVLDYVEAAEARAEPR